MLLRLGVQAMGDSVVPVKNEQAPLVEPWLRGTHAETPAVLRALELAQEDLQKWCEDLTDEEVNVQPFGLPSIAFQLRHIARSMDRLLTYAESRDLTPGQLAAMRAEADPGATRDALLAEVAGALESAQNRVRSIRVGGLDAPRAVGRKQIPTSVGGLIVHVADHTQRHVGQAVTTAKLLVGMRG
jgi:uncharacterized damage-inducible protein DinB